MIDEVWDYVFCRTQLTDDIVKKSGIPKATLEGMRREFEYFYPLDLRVSGKDLIPNHLTFFLYNHIGMCSTVWQSLVLTWCSPLSQGILAQVCPCQWTSPAQRREE